MLLFPPLWFLHRYHTFALYCTCQLFFLPPVTHTTFCCTTALHPTTTPLTPILPHHPTYGAPPPRYTRAVHHDCRACTCCLPARACRTPPTPARLPHAPRPCCAFDIAFCCSQNRYMVLPVVLQFYAVPWCYTYALAMWSLYVYMLIIYESI